MTAMTAAFAALLGAAVGSFLNVVIYRVPRGLSVVRPASRCPSCSAPIRGRDNVPVLSYLLLRGRCRACGAPFSARYPLVEAATAGLWAGAVVRFGPSERAAFVALATSVLLALAAIDLEHRRLPNVIVLPSIASAAVWVVAAGFTGGHVRLALDALAAGAAFFVLLLLIAVISGGMGFGDVKLAAFIGIFAGRFGPGVAVAAVLASFILGGLAAIVLLTTGARGRKDAVPFGPSLAVGAVLAVFVGPSPVRAWLGL